MSTEARAPWPLVKVDIDDEQEARVDVMGTVHTLQQVDTHALQDTVREWIAANVAEKVGRGVAVTIRDRHGLWHVRVLPSGEAEPSDHGADRPHAARRRGRGQTIAADPAASTEASEAAEDHLSAHHNPLNGSPSRPAQVEPAAAAAPATPPVAGAAERLKEALAADSEGVPVTPPPLVGTGTPSTRRSFLTEARSVDPAERGWRGFLARLGFPTKPSAAELAERDDRRAISQHWPGPRTIAIVNGKGGAGKTPTTVLLAALFAREGGAGVLAWDNNETRGTLGWRTEQGPHEAHVLDLLPRAESLLAPTARAGDLAAFLHHQTVDKFDVLRSNPRMLAAEQRITDSDFDAVHEVATKYFRLIFVDSGNDESASHWLRMVDRADQLVVPTTTRAEHAEAALLLLEALRERDERSRALADDAVVIVSQADKTERDAASIAAGFDGLARAAVTVPHDPALRETWLRWRALTPASKRAWLAAAAAVARGL